MCPEEAAISRRCWSFNVCCSNAGLRTDNQPPDDRFSRPDMAGPIQGRRAGMAMTTPNAFAPVIAVALPAAPVGAQTIRARADGLLEATDAPPGTVVRYTLDGTDPARDAGVSPAPVDVPAGYAVTARASPPDHTPVGTQVEWASRATGPRLASTLVPVTQGR